MILLFLLSFLITLASTAPGYDFQGLDFYHSAPALPDPILASPPIFKSAPIIESPPIIKTAPLIAAPLIKEAPIFAPEAPVFKAAPIIAPKPVIKTPLYISAPKSYASVTQYHIPHPVVKTVVAAPAPIIKTIPTLPLDYGHGYH